MITVKPAPDRVRAFARWAYDHGARTNSSVTFGVDERMIVDVPEELLIGAELDGQPYVRRETPAPEPEPEPQPPTKVDAVVVTAPF